MIFLFSFEKNTCFIHLVILLLLLLLHDFLGSAFPNTSEILSDVHGDLLKDLVDSVRFGLVLLAL